MADKGALPFGSLAKLEVALCDVLREQNELDEAHQRVTGVIERMKAWDMPTDRLFAYLTLTRVQESQGDFAGAFESPTHCQRPEIIASSSYVPGTLGGHL